MLVLKCKEGRRILVGNDIAIKVLESGYGWTRLGIEAPLSTNIVREEVLERDKLLPESVAGDDGE